MKVAMITPDLKFGWAGHVNPLVEHLRRIGVQVDLFNGHSNHLKTCLVVKKTAREGRYSLVHAQGSPYACFVSKKNAPIVTTVHTTLWGELQFHQNFSSIFGSFLERKSFNVTDQIIIVNKILAPELTNHYGVAKEKMICIHNAVDADEFDGFEADREQFVFSCGRNIARKGFNILKTACEKLGVKLLLAHGNMTRPQLIQSYKRAAMFVCSSYYETGPISIMEAMAAQCPVICSDIESVDGLVVPFETGLLFHSGDSMDLAQKIQILLEDENLRKHLSENAYEYVRRNYNWRDVAKKTIRVYEEVIKNASALN